MAYEISADGQVTSAKALTADYRRFVARELALCAKYTLRLQAHFVSAPGLARTGWGLVVDDVHAGRDIDDDQVAIDDEMTEQLGLQCAGSLSWQYDYDAFGWRGDGTVATDVLGRWCRLKWLRIDNLLEGLMLNTLTLVKRMTAAGMPVQQGEAVAETMAGAIEDHLATKRDIAEVRKGLGNVEVSLRRDIKELEANIGRDFKELEANVGRDIMELESRFSRHLKEFELKMQTNLLRTSVGTAIFIVTILGLMFRFMGR